jgi:hypothetical protein
MSCIIDRKVSRPAHLSLPNLREVPSADTSSNSKQDDDQGDDHAKHPASPLLLMLLNEPFVPVARQYAFSPFFWCMATYFVSTLLPLLGDPFSESISA